MRRVLLGTPTYDGNLSAFYVDSLLHTIKLAAEEEVEIMPFFICYDALVQRARNDIVKVAVEAEVDDLIFIDADIMWNPEDFFKLLKAPADVIGGIYPKKSDDPQFAVKVLSPMIDIVDGLIEVECIGTGFLRVSSIALNQLWDTAEEYNNSGKSSRMVFDIKIIEGELYSEDNILCRKWRDLGGQVFVDPYAQCKHVGVKVYTNNFMEFLEAHSVRT